MYIIIIVCISALFPLGDCQAVRRSSFGEYCNETIKCEKGAWLTCQSSSCSCLLQEMIFEPLRGKCVSKSGERCKFQLSVNTSKSSGISLYENTECVQNAHCVSGFSCSCMPGYFETIDGLCTGQKDFNELCSSDAECDESKLLYCVNNKCSCSSYNNQTYSLPNTGSGALKCVGKAGNVLYGPTSCIMSTTLRNGICVCDSEELYFAGLDRLCTLRKNLGDPCLMDGECKYADKFFTCVDGKCGCSATRIYLTERKRIVEDDMQEVEVKSHDFDRPDEDDIKLYYKKRSDDIVRGTWSRYNYRDNNYGYITITINKTVTDNLSQCVGLTNHACNPKSNCVQNADCNREKICICSNNFSPTSTGTCGVGYGQPCSASTPCSDSYLCTNGVCMCPEVNHQVHSPAHQKCVGISSAFCSTDSECLENLVCQVSNDIGIKQCACAEGFVESKFGNCEKAWNTTCDYSDSTKCDSVAELQCRNGVCSCSDAMTTFDSANRRCLGIVGSRCNVAEKACAPGARCIQSHPKLAGRCLCEDGFKITADSLCDKTEILSNETNSSAEFSIALASDI